MAGRIKFTPGRFLGNVARVVFNPVTWAILTIGVFVTSMFIEDPKELEAERLEAFTELQAEFARNARNGTFEGADLSLTDGNSLYVNGALVDLSFDFLNGVVALDGEGNADRMFTFAEYEEINPGRIQAVLEAGCDISAGIPSLMDQFAAENDNNRNEHENDIEAMAASFHNNYCPAPQR